MISKYFSKMRKFHTQLLLDGLYKCYTNFRDFKIGEKNVSLLCR